MALSSPTPFIDFAIRNKVGLITLNRPQAYNALNHDMAAGFHHLLDQCEDLVDVLVFKSNHAKVFCAGGDIREARQDIQAQRFDLIDHFFRSEYTFNHRLKNYKKPTIALVNGLTLGGGMGIAMHTTFCVADPSATFGMPETTIGFFPDIGAGYFYNQLPLDICLYLSLTGTNLSASQAFSYGLVSHIIPQPQWPALLQDLSLLKMPNGPSATNYLTDEIGLYFKEPSLEKIIEKLKQAQTPFAQKTLADLRHKSPTSLAVTFAKMTNNRGKLLDWVLNQDFILSQNFCKHPDFVEGIRAQVIDKDKNPRWQPMIDKVDSFFKPTIGQPSLFSVS